MFAKKMVVLFCFFLLFLYPVPFSAAVDHSLDFEDSSISSGVLYDRDLKYLLHQEIAGKWLIPKKEDIWINKSHSRSGKSSIGFKLEPKQSRVELKVGDMKNNQIKYIGFSIFVPSDYKPPTHSNLFAQWWQGAPAPPPVAFAFTPNVTPLKVQILTRDGILKEFNTKTQYTNTIPTNAWTDFIVKMRIDDKQGGNGILTVWQNGKIIVDYKGRLGYTDMYGHTNFRFGLYRSGANNSLAKVHFDEVKMGSSYNEVKVGSRITPQKKESTPKVVGPEKEYQTTANLNFRTGASTKYKVIKVIPKGKSVEYLSKSGIWYKVKYGKDVGWVSSIYLKKKENTSTIATYKQEYQTVANLNFRTGASAKYKVIKVIPKGKSVEYLNKSGIWFKVKYGKDTGWVSSLYLKKK